MSNSDEKKTGAVLVQGGGIAGVQASLDLANSGFKVYLVERDAAIGGMMAHLDKTFPTGDCATCIVSPKLVECARNLNIQILTLSELIGLTGQPGRFHAIVLATPPTSPTSRAVMNSESAREWWGGSNGTATAATTTLVFSGMNVHASDR